MKIRPCIMSAAALLLLACAPAFASDASPTETDVVSNRAARARIASDVVARDEQSFFSVTLLEGPLAGRTVEARCPEKYVKFFRPGRPCLVRAMHEGMVIVEPFRERALFALIALLAVCVAVTMGARGLRVLASIVIAVLLVAFVFLPLALRGWPPLLLAAVTGAPLCAGGIILIGGWNKKSLYAVAGSLCALAGAVWLPVIVCKALALTGLEREFGMFYHLDIPLWYSPALAKVDFYQLLLAGMIVASLGATMDVSMVVSTAVSEVRRAVPNADRGRLRRAGLGVGRDILGMMIIAIVLIYAGYQFEMMLFFHIRGLPYAPGLLLNYEEIAAEVVHMICTGLAMILAIPFTAAIAAHFPGSRDQRGRAVTSGPSA